MSLSGSTALLTPRAFTHACAILQIECSIDERNVRKRLGEIAHHPFRLWVVLF